jgi:hypothetical protein
MLPAYPDEFLAALDCPALLELMRRDEDRVPRAVVDACAGRGDAMTQALEDVLARGWTDLDEDGDSWLRLHAVMILGLIPTQRAGLTLAGFMRRMSEEGDENLEDWISGKWPALFANKPDLAAPEVRAIVNDRGLDWYVRANAQEVVVEAARRQGAAELDAALAEVAGRASDAGEREDMRACCALLLLDFPREEYRALLEGMADRQRGKFRDFTRSEVDEAFAAGQDEPDWLRFADPWVFYTPEAIAARQQRWAREAEEEASEVEAEESVPPPYIRLAPRIGRNDPCPCGSGKKFKKCCMPGAVSP